MLPKFQKGDKVAIDSVFIEERQSEPPERFTDGRLLHAMEIAGKESREQDEKWVGIGTPATRADVIEKLVSGGFAERVRKGDTAQFFVPTDLARLLYSVLPESLRSAEFNC